jgi:hypothetical protein
VIETLIVFKNKLDCLSLYPIIKPPKVLNLCTPIFGGQHLLFLIIILNVMSHLLMISLIPFGCIFLPEKMKFFKKKLEFSSFVENHYNAKIKIFRFDNGTEYLNNKFLSYFTQKEILHQTTCINTPEQNGISERKNHHILEITRSLLFQMNIPKHFLSEAVLTAVHIMNRLPSPILQHKIPIEVLETRLINLDHLKVLGCVCFVHKKKA